MFRRFRTASRGWRWAITALVAICVSFGLGIATSWRPDGDARPRQRVVVYYANETSPAAAESANYKALLATLRESESAAGATIARWIESDASVFRSVVAKDEADLFRAAREVGFDLAFFDNAKTLDGYFRHFSHRTGAVGKAPFGALREAENPILATSPLSRAVALRRALESVAALYGDAALDIVLITFSHGSSEMAVIPRVSTNLTAPDARREFLQQLARGSGAPAHPPAWAKIQGIDKKEYWQVLSDVSRNGLVRFPVVFRQSCASGIEDFAELRSLPASVSRVAHSATENMHLTEVDYGRIFSGMGSDRDWLETWEARLQSGPVRLQGRATLWIGPLMNAIASLHSAVFYLPLLAWLAWVAALTLRSSWRRARPFRFQV